MFKMNYRRMLDFKPGTVPVLVGILCANKISIDYFVGGKYGLSDLRTV